MATYILKKDFTGTGSTYNAPQGGGNLQVHFPKGTVVSGQQKETFVTVEVSGGRVVVPLEYLELTTNPLNIASASISNIPTPVKALLGLAAIFIFLKVVKVI